MNYKNRITKRNYKPFILLLIIVLAICIIAYVFICSEPEYYQKMDEMLVFQGEGTKENPYQISTTEEICKFRDLVNSGIGFQGYYFCQTADIDLQDTGNWIPIGKYGSTRYFFGTYDGKGHTIQNIHCKTTNDNVGLFGMLCGQVMNLGIESGRIEGYCIGSISSHGTSDAKIINCYNKADLIGMIRAGGIADNFSGDIISCWNISKIDSPVIGGISSYGANIRNCVSVDMPITSEFFLGEVEESIIYSREQKLYETIKWYEDKLNNYTKKMDVSEIHDECRIYLLNDYRNTAKVDEIGYDANRYVVCNSKQKNSQMFNHVPLIFLGISCFAFSVWFSIWIIRERKRGVDLWEKENDETYEPDEIVKRGFHVEVIITIVFTIVLFVLADHILMYKRDDGVTTMLNYYEQPKNTVDVLLLGSSTEGININNEVLWKEYGISAYSLWGSMQPFWSSYYNLKEALQYNTPKVVVLEVGAVKYHFEYSDTGRQYTNIAGVHISLNKFEAIQASAPQSRWGDLLWGFPIYHSRYNELSHKDFEYGFERNAHENDKGSAVIYGSGNRIAYSSAENVETIYAIDIKQEYYFKRIIEECKEKSIPLLLIATPYPERQTIQYYLNDIKRIAEEYDIPFINYNLLDIETGFSIYDIYTDNDHINIYGARKITSHLGKYLQEKYMLEDHRGDEKYSSWESFSRKHQNQVFPLISDRSEYINEIIRNDRSAFIIKYAINSEDQEINAFVEELNELGFDTQFVQEAGDSCIYIPNTKEPRLYRKIEFGCEQIFDIGDKSLILFPDGQLAIVLNNKTICNMHSGMICIVIDQELSEIVDVVYLFNPEKEEIRIETNYPIKEIDHVY